MMEVGEQIVGQIGEQHVAFLTQEAVFSPGRKAQAALVVAELLDFGGAACIISVQIECFGGKRQR